MSVRPDGTCRWAVTDSPEIPDNWIMSGELAFVFKPLVMKAQHSHRHTLADPLHNRIH